MSTTLVADRNAANVFQFDANIPIDAAQDRIHFALKQHLEDADPPLLEKGLNTAPNAGIVVTDPAAGIFQVTVEDGDLDAITDASLLYDVRVRVAASAKSFVVTKGVMRISGGVGKKTL